MARIRRASTPRDTGGSRNGDARDRAEEIASATKDYAIEQIIGPIRGAGRWLMYGLLGAAALGIGLLFGLLALLRLVQDLGGGALDGAWSFAPYLITAVAAAPAIGYSLSRINTEPLARDFDAAGRTRSGAGERE